MGEVEDKDSKKEGEFTLVLEVRMKGYGHEKHKEQLAERVLRELETKFGYDEFKVYMVKEKKGSFADPLVAV
jgi:hypothetical protein